MSKKYKAINLDCKGTKRSGNVKFNGTLQHWLIQLDYVTRHPLNGEIEFAVPYSSGNNRSYADIVNMGNGNMFEIKPDNLSGELNGDFEVTNYVNKANQYCKSTLPTGVAWNKGTVYEERNIPMGFYNKFISVRLMKPGVLGYEVKSNETPVSPPIVVPSSVIDKFKHLINRLKGNLNSADRIIAEYLQQNPDLATYIKTAAIGAGIAIIVGTIIEDILTMGTGIADDWACFTLAYRIIRYAIAL